MEYNKEAVIIPCGHTICYKNDCRNMLNGKCPECRQNISKIIKIYL